MPGLGGFGESWQRLPIGGLALSESPVTVQAEAQPGVSPQCHILLLQTVTLPTAILPCPSLRSVSLLRRLANRHSPRDAGG
jgi:hypothetical protein